MYMYMHVHVYIVPVHTQKPSYLHVHVQCTMYLAIAGGLCVGVLEISDTEDWN